jgi:hypothetical protein
MKKGSFVLLGALVIHAACAGPRADYRETPPDPELLHDALTALTDIIVYDIFNPPLSSRVYAYASVAGYEALRHHDPAHHSLAGRLNGLADVPTPEPDAEYYFPLAGVHAFMTVGKALTFTQERMEAARSAMHERVRRMGVPRDVFARSVAYGEAVAEHVLVWAAEDYYRETRSYPKFTVIPEPGRWVPTPPTYMDALEPNWHRLRPFVLDSANQFPATPPVPYDMTEGSAFDQQVKAAYEAVNGLTEDQRHKAMFWDDNSYVKHVRGHATFATKKLTPAGHWMGITQIAARESGTDIVRSAEAYVRTAVAVFDATFVCWEEKFRTNVVRPETVINAYIDEQWQPLLQTPPFPEYTSGHSAISGAAAVVLTDIFGDDFAFVDTNEVEFGLGVRSFESFWHAAHEAAISRLYGGIHYPMAIEEGLEQGRRVGELVLERVRTREASAYATTND